jgi:protein-disulfide isomerase
LPQIEQEYIKTGKVKYIVRDFPLESIHPQAFKAAEAARCAGEQGKYWEMHAQLFANQRALRVGDLPSHAQALGLDVPRFQQCLGSGKYARTIRRDLADGQKAGVTGTPSFFFGVTQPNEPTVKVLRVLKGAQPYTSFKEAIEGLLSSQE